MDAIVSSCRNAIRWLYNNLPRFNGYPLQMYVAGHSAGGHLASMLLVNDVAESNQIFLKGVILLSGLFRLEPLMLSNINEILQMDADTAIKKTARFI